jgi:hypothetical protein
MNILSNRSFDDIQIYKKINVCYSRENIRERVRDSNNDKLEELFHRVNQ